MDGDTYHGISVFGRGVFTDDAQHGWTYAGQCKDGYACGLGVTTWSGGAKVYAEHGPNGWYDGRNLWRRVNGDTGYYLYERGRSGGKAKDEAIVFANGFCMYNCVLCARDDPRVLALIAQVAPVEVRPAAPASHPQSPIILAPRQSSDAPARFAPAGARERHGHRGAIPTPHAVAGGRASQPIDRSDATRDHAVTCALADSK
jgi:hypothetical protein